MWCENSPASLNSSPMELIQAREIAIPQQISAGKGKNAPLFEQKPRLISVPDDAAGC
jgi:hypothetical protein